MNWRLLHMQQNNDPGILTICLNAKTNVKHEGHFA